MNTKEKILDVALEMFNNEGIEYVGMRELAAQLNIRVSNITYYFPTKDDLVYAVWQQLNTANSKLVVENNNITLQQLMEMLHKVFYNHVSYRCLLLSFVHLMEHNSLIKNKYNKAAHARNTTIHANITALEKNGYLVFSDAAEILYLVSTLSLIIRFWISEAAISQNRMSVAFQINHYLHMITKTIHPFASKKGKKELSQFLGSLHTD